MERYDVIEDYTGYLIIDTDYKEATMVVGIIHSKEDADIIANLLNRRNKEVQSMFKAI